VETEIQKWVGFLWIGFIVLWFGAAFFQKRAVRKESVASRLSYVSVGVLAGILMANPRLSLGLLSTPFVPSTLPYALLGLGLTVAGFAFAIWARVHLGRNWSGAVTIKKDHKFICSGPYALVRHPIYTGVLFALLGTSIVYIYTRWLMGLALAVLALKLKSLREEGFMTEQFGAEYANYSHRVKGLIPFVW
jgi:protein-S-isoprenylcysteine O-methyltransferase Ste14